MIEFSKIVDDNIFDVKYFDISQVYIWHFRAILVIRKSYVFFDLMFIKSSE